MKELAEFSKTTKLFQSPVTVHRFAHPNDKDV